MRQQQETDLILSGSFLLPDSHQEQLIENGAIAISQDRIAAIGTSKQILADYSSARHIHTHHGLIMPGLVNTHTHAAMSCFRGLADDLPLMTWLEEHIFPVETRLTADMVYQSTLLSLAEMIKSGTTSFCDMYLFSKEVARATEVSGMRAWIGEVLYDFPSPVTVNWKTGFPILRISSTTIRTTPGSPLPPIRTQCTPVRLNCSHGWAPLPKKTTAST